MTEEEYDASEVPQKSDITDLIDELRGPLVQAKVRQLAGEQAGSLSDNDDPKKRTLDRSRIFEYSSSEYESWAGSPSSIEFDHATKYDASPKEQMHEVIWSTQAGCPVDWDCDEQTAWGLLEQAKVEVDNLLASLAEEIGEYLDDGPFETLDRLGRWATRAHGDTEDLVEQASGWYEAINDLTKEKSEHWTGADADEAHEQFGEVVRQAGQNHTAMALQLQYAADAEAAAAAALYVGLQEALKNARNTICQRTYLDHYKTYDLLKEVSLIIGALTLPVSLGTTVAVIGFSAGALSYSGVKVEVDITVEHALRQSDADELVADLRAAAAEIYAVRTGMRTQIRDVLDTEFDDYFYRAATGALEIIPGQSFGDA